MRIFLDTNILLDIVEQRPAWFAASQHMLERCDAHSFELFVAPHGVATVFYIVRRKIGGPDARRLIHDLLGWATVAPCGDAECRRALALGIADYEDALQAACAEGCRAERLVTRDVAGFAASPVPAVTPDDFLQLYP